MIQYDCFQLSLSDSESDLREIIFNNSQTTEKLRYEATASAYNHKMMMMMVFRGEFMKRLIDLSHLTSLFHHFPSSKAFKSHTECFISQLYSSQDV